MTPSIQDHDFLSFAARQISECGEMLAEFCYSAAAGSRDFFLFDDFGTFQQRLNGLRPQTLVTLYKEYHLPLRGIVDKELIAEALRLIGDAQTFLIVFCPPDAEGHPPARPWYLPTFSNDTGHEYLHEALADELGERVAIGLEPEWQTESGNRVNAVVPGEDEIVRLGIY